MNRAALNDIMEAGVRSRVYPGAVLLCAQKDKVFFHRAYGVADLRTGKPVSKDAIFDLASLTKPMATTALVAVLIQSGRLSFDTRLKEIIPEVRGTPKQAITVDMLLRHTSGLAAWRKYYKHLIRTGEMTRQTLRQMILREPLEREPGKAQVYSDIGFMFLAWIIETLLGKRIDRAAANMVFQPLGIRDLFFIELEPGSGTGLDKTSYLDSRISPRLVSTQFCPWRDKTLTGEVDDDNAWAVGGIEGHAGLFGDAASVHIFCCEVLKALCGDPGKVFSPDVMAALVKKYPGQDMVAGFDSPSPERSSAGKWFSKKSVGHLGFTGTSFWIDPESGLIVILLTNRTHPSRANERIRLFRPLIHDAAAACFPTKF